jgi:hypothetical protein
MLHAERRWLGRGRNGSGEKGLHWETIMPSSSLIFEYVTLPDRSVQILIDSEARLRIESLTAP